MLERFIFCPCKHSLEVHAEAGCANCACSACQREVIDRLLESEREAIHRTWLGCGPPGAAAETLRAAR